MNGNNHDLDFENNSLKDIDEFQKNMYDPLHYYGSGKVPPTAAPTGNPTPIAVACFVFGLIFLAFGLFLFLSDSVTITSGGLIESEIVNKIITLAIMMGIFLLAWYFGFVYIKKAKEYYRKKAEWESQPIDETGEDKLWQRTCPKCGDTHDIDYPKCPNCNFDYSGRSQE